MSTALGYASATAAIIDPESPARNPEEFMLTLINRRLRITATDNRMFVGQLKCIDHYTNLILTQTWEYRLLRPGEKNPDELCRLEEELNEQILKKAVPSRFVGLITIRGKDIVRVQAEMGPYEEKGMTLM